MQKIKIEWHYAAFIEERDREPLRLKLKPRLGAWITEHYPLLLKRLKDDTESNHSTAMEVFSVKPSTKVEPIWLFCALGVNRTLPPDAIACIFPTQEAALTMMESFQQAQQEKLSGPVPAVNPISQEEFRSLFQKPEIPREFSLAVEERTEEVEWWADKQRRILGTLVHDVPDDERLIKSCLVFIGGNQNLVVVRIKTFRQGRLRNWPPGYYVQVHPWFGIVNDPARWVLVCWGWG